MQTFLVCIAMTLAAAQPLFLSLKSLPVVAALPHTHMAIMVVTRTGVQGSPMNSKLRLPSMTSVRVVKIASFANFSTNSMSLPNRFDSFLSSRPSAP